MSTVDPQAEKKVDPALVAAASDGRAPTLPPGLDATAAPEKATANPNDLGPDPESFTEVAEGNILVKLAVALLATLVVAALALAFGR